MYISLYIYIYIIKSIYIYSFLVGSHIKPLSFLWLKTWLWHRFPAEDAIKNNAIPARNRWILISYLAMGLVNHGKNMGKWWLLWMFVPSKYGVIGFDPSPSGNEPTFDGLEYRISFFAWLKGNKLGYPILASLFTTTAPGAQAPPAVGLK